MNSSNGFIQFVSFSGTHGSGKSTIIQMITERLTKDGVNFMVFPERTYVPSEPIGTDRFQMSYRKDLMWRERLINTTMDIDEIEFVLIDRLPIDVAIYSAALEYYKNPSEEYKQNNIEDISNNFLYYLRTVNHRPLTAYNIHRPADMILESVVDRASTVKHREKWKDAEQNNRYTEILNDLFIDVWNRVDFMTNITERDEFVNYFTETIVNDKSTVKELEELVDNIYITTFKYDD